MYTHIETLQSAETTPASSQAVPESYKSISQNKSDTAEPISQRQAPRVAPV